MIIPPFIGSNSLRGQLSNILNDGNTVANYQPGIGVTGALNASAWANQIGAAGSLLQASGTNQPIVLPFTGAKYVYLPAVASNTVTTPTKTITGNFTITLDIALNAYSPAGNVTLLAKTSGNDGFSVLWLTTDKVRLVIGDGVGLTNVDVVAPSGFTAGTRHTVTIVWQDGVGATFSYDGVQSGSQVAAAKTLTNAAVSWTLGSATSIGKVYDHTMTNSASTTYYHLNPAASAETTTNAATWTSDNGEVYTLNNTGAKLAQVVASPQLLFDGTAHWMQATFTLNQPDTLYMVFNQVTWTATAHITDGNAGDSQTITQTAAGASPQLSMYGGADLSTNSNLVLNKFGIMTLVYNGASSFFQIDNTTALSGIAGANNAGGLTIGAKATGTNPSNIQVKEIIARSVADSAGTRAQIKALLKALHNTP